MYFIDGLGCCPEEDAINEGKKSINTLDFKFFSYGAGGARWRRGNLRGGGGGISP
jgi:hypothetical protein